MHVATHVHTHTEGHMFRDEVRSLGSLNIPAAYCVCVCMQSETCTHAMGTAKYMLQDPNWDAWVNASQLGSCNKFVSCWGAYSP